MRLLYLANISPFPDQAVVRMLIVLLPGACGITHAQAVRANTSNTSPNGRFEVSVKSWATGAENAGMIFIRDKFAGKEHHPNDMPNPFRPDVHANWSADGQMVLLTIYDNHRERTHYSVLRWHKGAFTVQKLPEGTWALKWRGNESLECNVPMPHTLDMSKQPMRQIQRDDQAMAEVKACVATLTPETKAESTSPDGRFEVLDLRSGHIIRSTTTHEFVDICFWGLWGGGFHWSPDSQCLAISHQMPGGGNHAPSSQGVLRWNGQRFERLDVGDQDFYLQAWDKDSHLQSLLREIWVLTWNPKLKAFEP